MGDELFDLLAPAVAAAGLELVDVEIRGAVVRVVVDAPGGVALESLSGATHAVSALLDEHDPLPGQRYTLEVSSPGVERPLRAPRHFVGAVGERVTLRTLSGGAGERRFAGTLMSADDAGFELLVDDSSSAPRRFTYDDIERARTVFEWGASPRPQRPARRAADTAARRDNEGPDREKVASS